MIEGLSGWWKIIVRFLVDLIDRIRPDRHRVWHDAMGIYLERSGYIAGREAISLAPDQPAVLVDDGTLISASAGLVSDEIETSIEERGAEGEDVDLGNVSPCRFYAYSTSSSLLNTQYYIFPAKVEGEDEGEAGEIEIADDQYLISSCFIGPSAYYNPSASSLGYFKISLERSLEEHAEVRERLASL